MLSVFWSREPSSGGKKLSIWLNYLASGTELEQQEARWALITIGTNALPR